MISKDKSIDEICNPPKFSLQPQQKFVPQYLFENISKINGLLIYHNIGSGKTCTAIQIAEKFKDKYKIMCVLPASLIGNFINELYSECGKYKNINDIEKYYIIYSHNIFVKKINKKEFELDNTLLIIDEIQNMISSEGVFYDTLKTHIINANNTFKLIMLTGTPIIDNPNEIALTLNLLRPRIPLPIDDEFSKTFFKKFKTESGSFIYKFINEDLFTNLTKNLVSYYRGAPPIAYPKVKLETINCTMGHFQQSTYIATLQSQKNKKILSHDPLDLDQNSFYIKSRMASNIAFPNNRYDLFKNEINVDNIKEYSIKFYNLIEHIKKSNNKMFIYSNFILSGIKPLALLLELIGYKNYLKEGPGDKRYCIWSGDETKEIKEKIKLEFNKKENTYGQQIQIFLGSPAAREGITLKSVKEVHIMEPYWNLSRIKQIIGRVVRHCVHLDLPKDEWFVTVYIYLANYIDEYIWKIAKNKQVLIKKFEQCLKENAIESDSNKI
jgi:hypothetical protein